MFRDTLNLLLQKSNTLYTPLTIFIAIDYITGVCVAIKDKKISSKIGFLGILRKAMLYVVAILCRVADCFVLSSNTPIENIVLLFYISNEGISILENLIQLGVPFPSKIKDIFLDISKEKNIDTDWKNKKT